MGAYLDAAIKILKDVGKPLHYKEITRLATTGKLITSEGKTPADSMNAQITTNIKHKGADSKFIRIKAGVYDLKLKPNARPPNKITKSPNVTGPGPHFVGKGGEYLVAGRLILHGYNASMMGVDEGIDIVAVKNGKMYGIQVKTSNKSATGYVADINVNAFNRTDSGNMFYVFVLLGEPERYIILPFHTIDGLINAGDVKTIDKGKRYRATFAKKDGKVLLAKKDIKHNVNNWSLIK